MSAEGRAQRVSKQDILDAIAAAEPERAVNGLPDMREVAAKCEYSKSTVVKHVRELEQQGEVRCHDSVTLDSTGSIILTTELLEGDR